jgi:hypothetical protein
LVDIERAPKSAVPTDEAAMRTLAGVISGCYPAGAILRRGR